MRSTRSTGRDAQVELDRGADAVMPGPAAGRDGAPVVWNESGRFWAVRTQERARRMMRDRHLAVVQQPELATRHVPGAEEELTVAEFFGSWFSRNQRHAEVRRDLNPAFTSTMVGRLDELFRRAAVECHGRLAPEGDLMVDYFTPYGILTTARMLDVPHGQMDNVTEVIERITEFVKKPLSAAVPTRAEIRGMQGAIRYLRRLVEHLFSLPDPGPVLQALKRVVDTHDASVWLAVTTIGQLLAAGVEPMTNGAGLACREIFGRPQVRAALDAGEIEMQQVVEETLRLTPPFVFVHRWAQEPCDCLGVQISPGDHVAMDVRAVNRDPAVFDDPDAFRADRPRHLTLTFGRGAHTCLGMHSGRLQIAVALETLLERDPRLDIDRARANTADLGYLVSVPSIPYSRPRDGARASVPNA